jgi:hypothetical protein
MSYAALGKGRGRDRSKTSPTISRMSGSAATSNASGLCGAKFSPAQHDGEGSEHADGHHSHCRDHNLAPVRCARDQSHAEAESDQRGSEQPRSKRRHALGVEPQRLRAAAQDEKSKTGDFCLGRAEPSAIAMRARGRGTISRSQRGSLSAGEAQQPAGLISTSVARASHIAPGAIPRRGPGGPSTAMSTSLPEASAASICLSPSPRFASGASGIGVTPTPESQVLMAIPCTPGGTKAMAARPVTRR